MPARAGEPQDAPPQSLDAPSKPQGALPQPRNAPPDPQGTSPSLGERVYNRHCYFCHGYDGKAATTAATYLSPPPVDFTHPPKDLDRARMIRSVTHGRAGTAMQPFQKVLSTRQIAAVVDFIRATFMQGKSSGAYYHTPENGWPDMRRYAPAIPFALGKIPLDRPLHDLTPGQRAGRRLFMSSCITCHGRGQRRGQRPLWQPQRASSMAAPAAPAPAPSAGYDYGGNPHDHPPVLRGLTPSQLRGQLLFQRNCAYCHAADGSGKNWIGTVLRPSPGDLNDPAVAARLDDTRLRGLITRGVPDSAMSAWRQVLTPAQIADVIAYLDRAFLHRH